MSHRPKTPRRSLTASIGVLALVLGAGCAPADPQEGAISSTSVVQTAVTETSELSASPDQEVTSVDEHRSQLDERLIDLPLASLSEVEIDGLLWMREEEKLAHDVYVALFEEWGVRAFDNISRAETVHVESVLTLLDRYGIEDPGSDNPEGEFENPEIQRLYDELTERGKESVVEALRVGAYIEELDITDLRALASDAEDLTLVYDSLERGSRNHLRAFVRNLEQRAEVYVPTVLAAADFAEIVDSPTETGDGVSAAANQVAGGNRGYRGGRGDSSGG